MNHQVKYSKIALRDIDRVWDEVFKASKDYETTQNYIDDLMNKIKNKSEFPNSGTPLYYEDSFTGYYYILFKSYIAFYRVDDNNILVDRVLFAASDYIKILRLD